MDMNITLFKEDPKEEDFFRNLYDNPILNWSMLGIFMLGIVSCVGLAMVSWFERTGQAGPYRTLVNQLVSLNIDQLIVLYTFGFGFNTLRGVTGPLPELLCSIADSAKVYFPITLSMTMICITATRFAFIFIYKSIPVMDDNFLARFIFRSISINGLVITIGKFMLEERKMVYMRQCSGGWSDTELTQRALPVAAIIIIFAFIANMTLNVCIWMNRTTLVQPFNHQATPTTNLGSAFLSWALLSCFLLEIIAFLMLQRMGIEDLNSKWGMVVTMVGQTIAPFLTVATIFLYYVVTKKHFRRAIKDIWAPQQIHPVVE